MKIHGFTFNPLQENTYVIWCETTKEAAIVDAGNYQSQENQQLKQFVADQGLKVTHLLGTHAHIDHVFGNWYVKQEWNVPYYLHPLDIPMLDRAVTMAAVWNLAYTESPLPDCELAHGMKMQIGTCELEVRFVPGHSPGHVVFVNHQDHWVVGGDCLFRGSIGRTDLPGGNHDLLLNKIREEMFSLPDDFTVYSGHGSETSIGFEKANNPFFLSGHWE